MASPQLNDYRNNIERSDGEDVPAERSEVESQQGQEDETQLETNLEEMTPHCQDDRPATITRKVDNLEMWNLTSALLWQAQVAVSDLSNIKKKIFLTYSYLTTGNRETTE